MIKRAFSKQNRALLSEMIRTDFKLRYQGSVLGYLWSLLRPLMLFGILYTIFVKFLKIGSREPNFALSLLLGLVLWTFFTEATANALKSIVGRGGLIRKIKIPRYLIPVSSIFSAFINMLLNLIVVFIFVIFSSNTALSWQTVVFFPLLILELLTLSIALGLFLSAIYVRYRDIEHIWDVIRQALFYSIPIVYPLTRIPVEFQRWLILNPIAQVIQDARAVVSFDGAVQITTIYYHKWVELLPPLLVIILLVVGMFYFARRSRSFAEDI